MRRSAALLASGLLVAAGLLSTSLAPPAVAGVAAVRVPHLVVVYEENHSFDDLYADWGPVGLGRVPEGRRAPGYAAHSTQVDQAGHPIGCLLQVDANLSTTEQRNYYLGEPTKDTATPPATIPPTHPGPLAPACTGTTPAGTAFPSALPTSGPFPIEAYVAPSDRTCAPPTLGAPANGVLAGDPKGEPGGCTRDVVHRFYQEQYQLDGGRMDRYPTGSDAAGLTQGYDDTRELPVYRYLHEAGAPHYVVADHFFEAAFGGSFLNHQYLVAARPPQAAHDSTKSPVLDAAGFPNASYPLYAPVPGATYVDGPLTTACGDATTRGPNGLPVDADGLACGDYAVNTMQPSWRPTAGDANVLRGINDTDPRAADYEPTIGDRLSAAGVSWNWYSGGWDNAAGNVGGRGWTNGTGPACSDPDVSPNPAVATYPYCPDALFQFHHQPLNYFTAYAPGGPQREHLRDEQEFLDAVRAGDLPAVSFVKPVGEENEHPGYASTHDGESHLVDLLRAVDAGPQARDTVVVVTYDEFGGQWDHVPPPGQAAGGTVTPGPHDQYGPGTRIPALVVGRPLARSAVDRTSYDTTSVMATIERLHGLEPVSTRDRDVADLRHALRLAG